MQYLITAAIALVVSLVVFFSLAATEAPDRLGATGDTNFTNVVASGDITSGDDTTVSGGTLTVTTGNTATSTIIGGCIQTYATSTATPFKFYAVASTTQIAPGYNAFFYGAYGSCP